MKKKVLYADTEKIDRYIMFLSDLTKNAKDIISKMKKMNSEMLCSYNQNVEIIRGMSDFFIKESTTRRKNAEHKALIDRITLYKADTVKKLLVNKTKARASCNAEEKDSDDIINSAGSDKSGVSEGSTLKYYSLQELQKLKLVATKDAKRAKDLKKPFVRKCPGGCLKNNQPWIFENIHSFRNHLNTKHFKLECPLCDEEFHTMSSREMHMAKKHLVCERCSGNCTSLGLMSYFLIFYHIDMFMSKYFTHNYVYKLK